MILNCSVCLLKQISEEVGDSDEYIINESEKTVVTFYSCNQFAEESFTDGCKADFIDADICIVAAENKTDIRYRAELAV